MKFRIVFTMLRLIAICHVSVGLLYAEDPAASLQATYQAHLDEAELEEELELTRLGRQYVDQLDLLFDQARESANLENARAVYVERNRFRDEGKVAFADADLPALRRLQNVYLDSAFRIRRERARKVMRLTGQMNQALANLERQLTSENRIDEALRIRQTREALTTSDQFSRFRKLASASGRFSSPAAIEGIWHVLRPQSFHTPLEAKGEIGEEGVVLVSGETGQDTYQLEFVPSLQRITAVRLDALADDRLPNGGPGRAHNGNFVLNRFRLFVESGENAWEEVGFQGASAGFSQTNWPVEGAIDDNNASGWAVSPETGRNHQAIFILAAPLQVPPGSRIQLRMVHNYQSGDHSLGKFRISITDAANPLADRE
ncbi:MAG: hypothetical protein JJU29_03995 [Verrucomicrobia bacterium]|nr:hypothetical protein [Verrucomicrobiota bacterium]MCH8512161.1 UPF0236 family protein [Kiritimatiellia bacterium]